jgi:hypothetical protein
LLLGGVGIPVLIANKLLKPLGSPPQNATRYFAGPDLEKVRTDSKWLNRASATLIRHWRKKNEGRKGDAELRIIYRQEVHCFRFFPNSRDS